MRPQCFREYEQCVGKGDYFDYVGDLDCALGLVACVKKALSIAVQPPDRERVRQVLESRREELTRIRTEMMEVRKRLESVMDEALEELIDGYHADR